MEQFGRDNFKSQISQEQAKSTKQMIIYMKQNGKTMKSSHMEIPTKATAKSRRETN